MKEQLKETILSFKKMLMDTEAYKEIAENEQEAEKYQTAISTLTHVINTLERIDTSDNLKSQNIYLLRQMYRLELNRCTTVGDYRQLLDKLELLIVEHNTMYNDTATSNVFFADEKTIAKKYPL